MLERVISITNVGRFRNSASTPNPGFGRQTLVFAPNGYGKTTLCAILRSLERDEPDHVLARRSLGVAADPVVNLLWSGAQRQFRNSAWPAAEPRLSIFDGTFVAENVHSGDFVEVANRRSLYRVIVGRDGVGLAQQEAQLAEEARATQTQLTTAERAVSAISGGMTQNAFDELAADPNVAERLADERRALQAQQEAASIRDRPLLKTATLLAFPPDLGPTLRRSLNGIGAEAEERIAHHIHLHGLQDGGHSWLAHGTAYATDRDDCPFCGRDGLEGLDLVRAYRALFGEGYRELRAAIRTMRDQVANAFGPASITALRTLEARNGGGLDYWERYCAIDRNAFASLDAVADDLTVASARLLVLIDAKVARPLDEFEGQGELEMLGQEIAAINARIESYNAAIAAANILIEAKKADTAGGDVAAVSARIARLEAVERRHSADGISRCDHWRNLDAEKRRLVDAKAAVRTNLEAHCDQVVQPYQERINHFLRLFNAGFSIARVGHTYPGGVATSTYMLRIDNIEVALGDAKTANDTASFKNTLSAGDRTTLAMAFFLAGLEREPDLANRVVVFDDPFNSQDAFRRRQTVYEIMAVARSGAQVIVLSHDPMFLKAIWEKCPPAERAAVQLSYHSSIGSKIMTFDLDNACRGRAAAELDALLAFRASGAGDLREIIKKLRIVLETHYRCTFTGSFGPDDNLGEILRKIRAVGAAHPAAAHLDELDRINDYTAEYHHGQDARGEPEPFLDREELSGFVNQTIQLANASPS